jgi:hypothetical protein
MGSAIFAGLLAAGFCVAAAAQGLNAESDPDNPSTSAAKHSQAPANPPKVLTGKERLGRKWTDEQRVDNCNVPPDKRGSKPRPTACTQAATGW